MTPETLPPELLTTTLKQASELLITLLGCGLAIGVAFFLLGIWAGKWLEFNRAEKLRGNASSLEIDLRDSRRARVERQRMGRELKALIAEGETILPPKA